MRALRVTMIGAALLAAACQSPPPTGGTTTTQATTTTTTDVPSPPVINSFTGVPSSSSAPLTTSLQWSIGDPNGDPMTCQLDLDGNATYEVFVGACTSSTLRTVTFDSQGAHTVGLRVSDGALSATTSTVLNVGAPAGDQFNITLRLAAGMSASQISAFNTAAARWATVIKTGLPDIAVGNPCSGYDPIGGPVDDLFIDAEITPIDGPGNILGQAGPCWIRGSSTLPISGLMKFDSADVANLEASGRFVDTILHEMGHVLGFGTIWTDLGLLNGAGTGNPTFNGAASRGIWQGFGGSGNVPVANTGGPGTADAHWRESTFGNELMTGYLGSSNPLSTQTIAGLADLGYGVDLGAADAYGLPGLRLGPTTGTEIGEILLTPEGVQ